jgi:FkbM family methyltransferase
MINKIKEYCEKDINSIIEIGSAHGHDADYLAKEFKVNPKNVHIFEPRKNAYNNIKKQYPQYNTYNIAVSNFSGSDVEFFVDSINGEISSLLYREINKEIYEGGETIFVEVETFKNFCKKNNIEEMDLVKIDTEGCTFEVLSGFEDLVDKVKVFHLESENIHFWKNQKLTNDVLSLIPNFELKYSTDFDQTDLILVNKYLK